MRWSSFEVSSTARKKLASVSDQCHHFCMPLVFVYGPDTQQGRMYDRIGPSNMLTAAVLPGYRLVFNKPDRRNPKEGKANLVEAEDAQTFGLLFDLKDRQLEMLDGFFGGYQQQRVRPVPVGTE